MKKFKNHQRLRKNYGTDLISCLIKNTLKSGETVPLTLQISEFISLKVSFLTI
jgi:hypothetical protein